MKYTLSLCIIAALFLGACKNDKSASKNGAENISVAKDDNAIALNKKIFAMATHNKDFYTALYAANAIIALDSANAGTYYDTLATIYAGLNQIEAASQMANKVLAKDPNNRKMLEIKASSAAATGDMANAMTISKKLYEISKEPKYLFNIATLNIQAGNYGETESTLDQLEKDPRYGKDSVEMPGQRQGQFQRIPLEAAVIYLRGNLDLSKNRIMEGATKIKQAIDRFPNFYLARRDMQMIQQSMQQQQAKGGPQGPPRK